MGVVKMLLSNIIFGCFILAVSGARGPPGKW
jgi:hypothetical protein